VVDGRRDDGGAAGAGEAQRPGVEHEPAPDLARVAARRREVRVEGGLLAAHGLEPRPAVEVRPAVRRTSRRHRRRHRQPPAVGDPGGEHARAGVGVIGARAQPQREVVRGRRPALRAGHAVVPALVHERARLGGGPQSSQHVDPLGERVERLVRVVAVRPGREPGRHAPARQVVQARDGARQHGRGPVVEPQAAGGEADARGGAGDRPEHGPRVERVRAAVRVVRHHHEVQPQVLGPPREPRRGARVGCGGRDLDAELQRVPEVDAAHACSPATSAAGAAPAEPPRSAATSSRTAGAIS
jgi:hypothetical protein